LIEFIYLCAAYKKHRLNIKTLITIKDSNVDSYAEKNHCKVLTINNEKNEKQYSKMYFSFSVSFPCEYKGKSSKSDYTNQLYRRSGTGSV